MSDRIAWSFGPCVGPARAAVGTFPYPHPTVAQVDAVEATRYNRASEVMKGPVADDEDYQPPASSKRPARFVPPVSTLPTSPCFRCGARSGCDHQRWAA